MNGTDDFFRIHEIWRHSISWYQLTWASCAANLIVALFYLYRRRRRPSSAPFHESYLWRTDGWVLVAWQSTRLPEKPPR